LVSHAIDRMKNFKISQIPVQDINGFVGSIDEADLFKAFIDDKDIADKLIKDIMGEPFPIVQKNASVEEVSKLITKENQAVLVDLGNKEYHIITKHDIINSIS
ncbi:MAG: CBS domain-containing protein, partial [Flavobacteriaceae bacterium]|nr:CBS domain-containing protein [Flavobacteriaceae bacterium]